MRWMALVMVAIGCGTTGTALVAYAPPEEDHVIAYEENRFKQVESDFNKHDCPRHILSRRDERMTAACDSLAALMGSISDRQQVRWKEIRDERRAERDSEELRRIRQAVEARPVAVEQGQEPARAPMCFRDRDCSYGEVCLLDKPTSATARCAKGAKP